MRAPPNEPLAGVAFKVVDGSGKPLNPDGGIYYTNNAGEIVLEGLEPGTTITAQEVKTVDATSWTDGLRASRSKLARPRI